MMAHSKKDKPIAIRIPERTKRLIEEEADKNTRNFQDEALVLLTEALHQRKYSMKNYV
jgi:hypothetical protein